MLSIIILWRYPVVTKKKVNQSKKPTQNFSVPISILLFEADAKKLGRIARETGIHKSQLIRLAVANALKVNSFDHLITAS